MGEDYRVRRLEKELDLKDRMLVDFLAWASTWYRPQARPPSVASKVADYFRQQAEVLSQLDDPHGIYAHCQCEVE